MTELLPAGGGNKSIIKKMKSIDIGPAQNAGTSKSQLSILPRIGYGMNLFNGNLGIFTGGSISYGNNRIGYFGGNLMYIMTLPQFHPILSGFYERSILNLLHIKGGIGMNLYNMSPTIIAGGGFSFFLGRNLLGKVEILWGKKIFGEDFLSGKIPLGKK